MLFIYTVSLKILFNELYNLKVVSFLYDFYFLVELLNATENEIKISKLYEKRTWIYSCSVIPWDIPRRLSDPSRHLTRIKRPGITIATLQRNISHHNHCWAQHVAYVWPLHYTLEPTTTNMSQGINLYIFKLEPTTPIMSQQSTLRTAAEPAVSGAVKTGLSYRNNTIICLFFTDKKF